MIEITVLGSDSKGKVPISPYADSTFHFSTASYSNLKDAFLEMSTSFTMSKPFSCNDIRLFRRKVNMLPYKLERIKNIAIDIDEITTKVDYLKTIKYFTEKDYMVILGKSRRWDGKEIFNIKGLMVVDLLNEPKHIKNALSILQRDLGHNVKIDMSVGDTVSYQAPTTRCDVIYSNENGTDILDDEKATLVAANQKTEKISKSTSALLENVSFSNDIVDLSLDLFGQLGFEMMSNRVNANSSINFKHGHEVKSVGGYFWFRSNPFLMHHNNTERTVNIFGYVKDTLQGKEFLKDLNKKEQKKQLLPSSNSDYTVDTRFLQTNDRTDKMLDIFLQSKKDVIKVTSAMGTGKSNIIGSCIEKAHKNYLRVLIISNRISVAKDFSEKYSMKMYLDPEDVKPNESLIVQFDSLYRYDLQKFDVIILDEFMSILLHHRSNLTSNQNLNVAKFYVALKQKKILIADAFLTGFEDMYLKNRTVQSIVNTYRDDIDLFEYKNSNKFIENLIGAAKNVKNNESISCSFMSVNVLKVVEKELKKNGVKVITLTSETPEITKGIIYEKFNDSNNNAWDAILYTPTLTVGVSNLNRVSHQFHYDTGNAGGVIDSLQMVKRSRNAKEIHFFLQERQFYKETDLIALNASADLAIKYHYKNQDKTLLVDMDYSTGEFSLSELGGYINSIESFNNILENNHANAFRILLHQQFKNPISLIDDASSFNLKEKVKDVKKEIINAKIDMLRDNEDVQWDYNEIREISAKTTELSPEEQIKLMMSKVQEFVQPKIPRDKLISLCACTIEDYEYISKCRRLKDAVEINTYNLRGRLSKLVSSDIHTLQDKGDIHFIEYCMVLGTGFKLNSWYSRKDVLQLDKDYGYGKQFENFAKSVGYKWKNNRLLLDKEMFKYIPHLKQKETK